MPAGSWCCRSVPQLRAGVIAPAALLVLAVIPGVATAEVVRISFVARVESVYDPGDALDDAIHRDQLLRGTFTYDSTTPDTNPQPTVGTYEHHRAPYGILIEAGTFIFQSNPDRVELSIVVSNDHGSPARDSYVVTSTNNLPFQSGAVVSRISWELVDDTQAALDSTALTTQSPDLTKWRSEFGLTLEGRRSVDFLIRAHVTETRRCSSDADCRSR